MANLFPRADPFLIDVVLSPQQGGAGDDRLLDPLEDVPIIFGAHPDLKTLFLAIGQIGREADTQDGMKRLIRFERRNSLDLLFVLSLLGRKKGGVVVRRKGRLQTKTVLSV